MSTAPWRLAKSLEGLRREVNARWPNRSKASDGTIGNSEHAARPSDHNRNSAGVVRAFDCTANGIDAPWLAEHLRELGAAGHPALRNGGVVIYNRRITSSARGWTWRNYTGVNPHVSHVHTSVSRDAHGYDSAAHWGITNNEDNFMPALSHAEQRELLDKVRLTENHAHAAVMLSTSTDQRCERLEASIHGTNDTNRGDSIWWRVRYLFGELLDGDNAPRLRIILRKFGVPS